MAEIGGSQIGFSRVASGDLPAYRFATLSGKDAYLTSTSGEFIAGVTPYRADDNGHAGLVTAGHAKIQLANSLGIGVELMAGDTGFAVQAGSGQWVGGFTVSAATSGAIAEMVVNIHRKTLVA